MSAVHIDLAFPAFPPALDGIGDHTARLAAALAAAGAEVRVLTAEADPAPVAGVDVRGGEGGPYLDELEAAVAASVPDVLLAQYNPFSWGRYGLNLALPERVRRLRARHPALRLAVMVHEPFVPFTTWPFRVMASWQRWQLWRLGRSADVLFFSIERWRDRFAAWFPGVPCHHLPVGSNIGVAGWTRGDARARLGLDGRFVLGLFGSASEPVLGHVRAACDAVGGAIPGALLVYVGTHGAAVQGRLVGHDVLDLGPLDETEVSRAFAAMDLYLAPYPDGATTRRGTLMAGLAHGVPTLSTDGVLTSDSLREASPSALVLSDVDQVEEFGEQAQRLATDGETRAELGAAGRRLYDQEFEWSRVADRMLSGVRSAPTPPRLAPVSHG